MLIIWPPEVHYTVYIFTVVTPLIEQQQQNKTRTPTWAFYMHREQNTSSSMWTFTLVDFIMGPFSLSSVPPVLVRSVKGSRDCSKQTVPTVQTITSHHHGHTHKISVKSGGAPVPSAPPTSTNVMEDN